MLVRSVALRNIRSYNSGEEARVDLPEGVVLLEGDIGSGKSSLLYALEFALFGFSDMKGAHLLSEGKKEGSVSVTFESDGSEYTIDRRLKVKGEEVVQEECHITSGGERTRLSPSDLKERVVAILGFNEPTHPKAESLVYRYAVFTPQEQMKEILMQNPEARLHVIRRVLGAQSYQVAAENSDLVESRIKQVSFGLKKSSEDLEDKKERMQEVSRTIAQLESDIPALRVKETNCSKKVRTVETELKDSQSNREFLGKGEARLPLLRQEIADLQEDIAEGEGKLKRLEAQLADDLDPVIKRFAAKAKPQSAAGELEAALNRERDNLARLRESKRALEEELSRSRELVSKGICPMCGQKITGDVTTRAKHSELESARVEAQEAEASLAVATLTDRLAEAREYEEDERECARALKDKKRVDGEIDSLRRRVKESNGRLAMKTSELAEATAQTKELRELSDRISGLELTLKQARDEEKRAGLELNQSLTEREDARGELGRLKVEVEKKEAAQKEARRLTGYQAWLSSFFRPAVELIEEQTLSLAAARFNEHFQRYFTSLVDDPDMIVRVKEDFSPLFEREGFEQDFEALSGGERTSMALAYRFALNTVVRESAESRPELIILDEPTDGFSKDQVYKMRGLLEALGSRQVILVSHERELESMADHVFRVEKRNGTSVVTAVQV
jgi:DNA repair protein SbcC/Rad50